MRLRSAPPLPLYLGRLGAVSQQQLHGNQEEQKSHKPARLPELPLRTCCGSCLPTDNGINGLWLYVEAFDSLFSSSHRHVVDEPVFSAGTSVPWQKAHILGACFEAIGSRGHRRVLRRRRGVKGGCDQLPGEILCAGERHHRPCI